mgnify:CR=1 FL=1
MRRKRLAQFMLVLSFLGMTKAEKIDAVYREMGKAGAWRYTEVAAFIVERDAKRDSAWAEYARARAAYTLTIAEHDYDERRVEVESATLDAAKRALRDLGVDVDALAKAVSR